MKVRVGFAAVAAVTAMVGAALAADGDQFLVRGDATKATLEQNMLNIATAEKIAQACVAEAKKEGVRVSIAILDQFGEQIYFYRMDGQGKQGIATAFLKAKTTLNTRQPSRATANAVARGASEFRQWSFGNFPQGADYQLSSMATSWSAPSASAARLGAQVGTMKSAPGAG